MADLSELDALYQRTSRGPWKADKIANFGENWPIGIMSAGESRACDGQHIVTTDGVPASMANSDAEADCQWVAAIHNAWPEIVAALPPDPAPSCGHCNGTGIERSNTCHCGDLMDDHSPYDNHSALEMTRPCEFCTAALRAQLAAETQRADLAEKEASFNANSGHATAVELRDEITELKADNERLRGTLVRARQVICGGPMTLKELYHCIDIDLAATPAQSLSLVKAEALRGAKVIAIQGLADYCRKSQRRMGVEVQDAIERALDAEAERLAAGGEVGHVTK